MPYRFAIALAFLLAAGGLIAVELEPFAPGPYAVATTNLEAKPQESTAVMFDFLNGKANSQSTRYLTDILIHPEAVPTLQIDVPADPKLFGKQAGSRIPLVLLVVYPTTKDNPRPDYPYPYEATGDALFTHMQGPGDKPLFADAHAKYPLIIHSGGYNTHGLWHLGHMKELAAHGYIVVDMFHGDGRGPSFGGNLALRSLELRATLDFLLQHPEFGPAIDAARIGAVGISAGGHTLATALGGSDPTGRLPDCPEPRIKAAFGIIPFLGGSAGTWPFKIDMWYFGEDHAGLRRVQRPFFAVYGGKDTNVPPEGVEDAVRQMAGPATAVILEGETHSLTKPAHGDIRTWELLFFDAWLKDDAAARQKLATGTSVREGVTDRKTFDHVVPGQR